METKFIGTKIAEQKVESLDVFGIKRHQLDTRTLQNESATLHLRSLLKEGEVVKIGASWCHEHHNPDGPHHGYSEHRSYAVCREGIIVSERSRNIETVGWGQKSDVSSNRTFLRYFSQPNPLHDWAAVEAGTTMDLMRKHIANALAQRSGLKR